MIAQDQHACLGRTCDSFDGLEVDHVSQTPQDALRCNPASCVAGVGLQSRSDHFDDRLSWTEVAAEAAKEFPDVAWDKMIVDAMTMRMASDAAIGAIRAENA
ncbi:MAG: hypothetical protein QM651_17105 [Rhodoblastus sp.]